MHRPQLAAPLCLFVLLGVTGPADDGRSSAKGGHASSVGNQPSNLLTAEVKQAVSRAGDKLLKLAEVMPEEFYGVQVVPDIPTFAATLRQTIDGRLRACAVVAGSSAQLDAVKSLAKADLLPAMRASVLECNRALAGLTDAVAIQALDAGPRGPASRLSVLYDTVARDSEMYGYLALHLRLKGIEPPVLEGGSVR